MTDRHGAWRLSAPGRCSSTVIPGADPKGWFGLMPIPSNEFVRAEDLREGDVILYAGLAVTVHRTGPASWVEGDRRQIGVEIECRDAGGTARLFLYRVHDHQFERITR